jgi:hypothetical protein
MYYKLQIKCTLYENTAAHQTVYVCCIVLLKEVVSEYYV